MISTLKNSKGANQLAVAMVLSIYSTFASQEFKDAEFYSTQHLCTVTLFAYSFSYQLIVPKTMKENVFYRRMSHL